MSYISENSGTLMLSFKGVAKNNLANFDSDKMHKAVIFGDENCDNSDALNLNKNNVALHKGPLTLEAWV